MTVALRNTVKSTKDFIGWAARAAQGEQVTYHIGNLGCDRADSPVLHQLAETVLIFAEAGFVVTSQVYMRLPLGSATWYYISRTGGGRAPRSMLAGKCNAFEYRALQAVQNRDADKSAARAIRDHMGCPEHLAGQYLDILRKRAWVEPLDARGFRITPEGLKMLM